MNQKIYEELQNTRSYVKKKALELMNHEKKSYAVAGVPFQNYRLYKSNSRLFYSVQMNTFKVIVDDFLVRAQTITSEKFGTGEAKDVVEALYMINPMFGLDGFTDYLKNEKCTYIFESEAGVVVDRILRIDLFRLIQKAKNGKGEFTGGLLHALKHFSKQGINYSTGKCNYELDHPHQLIQMIVDAFFVDEGHFENENEYVVLKELDDNYHIKYVFYREQNTGVFFLNTIYKEPK